MSKWCERVQQVERLARSFQLQPLAGRYRPRLWPCQPSSVWKLFPRQSAAISFAQSCKEAVHVFSLEREKSVEGERIYLVTSYTELWHYYRTFPRSLMHCYEVIVEGAVSKLYFDLEFHKPSNREADGKMMVASLIQFFCKKLKESFGIECLVQNVLTLDSGTEDKFSQHLIFNLPNAVFKDNTHVGGFIRAALQPILSETKSPSCSSAAAKSTAQNTQAGTCAAPEVTVGEGDEVTEAPEAKRRKQEETELSFLKVKNRDGRDALFVDLGVYTKNRNFRLYKSSKAGKKSVFTLADNNMLVPKLQKGVSAEERVFLASLVCNVSFTGQRILTWDVAGSKTPARTQSGSAQTEESLSGCQTSPHQEVDHFVLTLLRKDGIQGNIRRWNYFVSEQLLVYDIVKYRWCENVGRFHQSNNIMIVVDLNQEVWYQKCHDPDCRNFRSSSYPLPQDICVSYILNQDEEEQAYLMDPSGNIEPSSSSCQASVQTTQSPPLSEGKDAADVWGDAGDDQDYVEILEEFEGSGCEIPDQLLLGCVAEFEAR